MSLAEFMDRVVPDPSGCWLYNGERDRYGSHRGRPAHRVSWELHRGEIPPGMMMLHGCDVKGCVNPDHLRPGTARNNAHDLVEARRRQVRDGNLLLSAWGSGGFAADWCRVAARRGVCTDELFIEALNACGIVEWLEEQVERLDALDRANRRGG